MAFSSGNISVTLDDVLKKVSEADLLFYYLGVTEIPCVICSPLRMERNPSFSISTIDGHRIHWRDFATRESGNILDLFEKLWKLSYNDVIIKMWNDANSITKNKVKAEATVNKCVVKETVKERTSKLECKVREWQDHDIQYWRSFGIEKEWLQFADVYPISHKIITKGNRKLIFGADKYAYAYVERKENNITLKIYQPFNQKGFKWSNQHDRSIISLWAKLPETGNRVCICSSLKDALCLWANTGIPSIALQGEGYGMSETAISELKKRFKQVFILFDNDEVGIADGEKLAKDTGFLNVVLPYFEGGKDISDMYKVLQNKQLFQDKLLPLFKTQTNDN
ncbi:MAG: toprim domain-containing protein [Agathobacter sp.]|nr:toprim domain-containing protein [Agathobacter sp.]